MAAVAFIRGVGRDGEMLWRIVAHADLPIGCPPGGHGCIMEVEGETEEFYDIVDDEAMGALWETRWWLEDEGIVAYASEPMRMPVIVRRH